MRARRDRSIDLDDLENALQRAERRRVSGVERQADGHGRRGDEQVGETRATRLPGGAFVPTPAVLIGVIGLALGPVVIALGTALVNFAQEPEIVAPWP